MLERAQLCKSGEASDAIAVFLEAGLLDDAPRLFDMRHAYVSAETTWRLFVRAAECSPTWAIGHARRHAEGIIDRVERKRYEIAVRWLRIASFALRIDGREAEWATYRQTLLVKHKAKKALIPLISAMR